MTTSQMITIIGSGVVGALAYTWSDTYWFSAVEGEVYGYSSLFTAVVFWLILKWEDNADDPHSDRWLILIAYLVGLSIGVHLLNLLCIPAIVLVAYYRKAPNANLKGSLVALALSMVLVAAVLYGIVPGVVKVGGWFELFFVNTLGMPFNTGVIIYLALFAVAISMVFRFMPYQIGLIIIPVALLFLDREALKQVDYGLLFTFVFFFIFAGNMGRIEIVREFFSYLLNINTLIFSAMSCQIISNVPSAILLSQFTDNYRELLLGVNIGGAGTLIASLASLITFKEYTRQDPKHTLSYILKFSAFNFAFLIILTVFCYLFA
jgi:hypothetical protein